MNAQKERKCLMFMEHVCSTWQAVEGFAVDLQKNKQRSKVDTIIPHF